MYDDGVVTDYDPDPSSLLVSGPIKNINITGIQGPVTISSSGSVKLTAQSVVIDSPVEFKQAVTKDQNCTVKGTFD